MRDFVTTWRNLLKHRISDIVVLVKSALRKELFIAPFIERINTATFGKC